MILPSAPDIANSFATFDRLVQTINQARRNARDFVVQKTTTITNDDDDEEDDWNVSIHCAHLHPDFQDAPPPPTASALPHQPPPTSLSDIMIHNKEVEYRKLRLVARRSPYPTILIEVKASPSPIDFRNMALTPAAAAPYGQQPAQIQPSSSSSAAVAADIQKLHALFGKTAAVTKDSAATTRESENQDQRVSSSSRDSFWDALGDSIPEVTTATPVSVAQQWMSDHQQSLMIHTSRHGHDAAAAETSNDRSSSSDMTNDAYIAAFTTSETTAVDEAMEFVFTNIAMLQEQCRAADPSFGVIKSSQYDTPMATAAYQQQYLVLPRFLATAATSFEKFGVEVSKIVVCLPNLPVSVAAYHPEHVDAAHRSPVPILALTWNQEHSNMHQDVLQ